MPGVPPGGQVHLYSPRAQPGQRPEKAVHSGETGPPSPPGLHTDGPLGSPLPWGLSLSGGTAGLPGARICHNVLLPLHKGRAAQRVSPKRRHTCRGTGCGKAASRRGSGGCSRFIGSITAP